MLGDHDGLDPCHSFLQYAVDHAVIIFFDIRKLLEGFAEPQFDGFGRLGAAAGQALAQLRHRRRQDKDKHAVRIIFLDLERSLHVDLQNHVRAAGQLFQHRPLGRAVVVAIDLGEFQQLAAGDMVLKGLNIGEKIADAVDLSGTRLAGRHRNR